MVLRELIRDPTIAQAHVVENVDEQGFTTYTKAEEMKENLQILREPDEDSEDDEDEEQTGGRRQAKKPTIWSAFKSKEKRWSKSSVKPSSWTILSWKNTTSAMIKSIPVYRKWISNRILASTIPRAFAGKNVW